MARAGTADPFSDTQGRPDRVHPQDKRQPYAEQDIEALLAAAPIDMRVLLRLGASAGLRASKITGLTWDQVELAAGTAQVLGKGRKVRKVVLVTSLLDDLQVLQPLRKGEWIVGRTPEAARKRLRTLYRRAGVAYLGLHALRHTAGTQLVRAGFDLQDVAEHLGHSDIQTARTYDGRADDRLRNHFRRQ